MATPAFFCCLNQHAFRSGYHLNIDVARQELIAMFTAGELDSMYLMFLVPVKEIPA